MNKIFCQKCNRQISNDDEICSSCKSDLSKVGRRFELTLKDSLKLSDEVFAKLKKEKIKLKWEQDSLTLFSVFVAVFLSLIPLLKIWFSLSCSFIVSLLLTAIILIAITKINCVSNIIIKFLRWLMK